MNPVTIGQMLSLLSTTVGTNFSIESLTIDSLTTITSSPFAAALMSFLLDLDEDLPIAVDFIVVVDFLVELVFVEALFLVPVELDAFEELLPDLLLVDFLAGVFFSSLTSTTYSSTSSLLTTVLAALRAA